MANTFKVMMMITIDDKDLLPGEQIIDAIYEYLAKNNISGTIDTLHLSKIFPHYVQTQIDAINQANLEVLQK